MPFVLLDADYPISRGALKSNFRPEIAFFMDPENLVMFHYVWGREICCQSLVLISSETRC